MQVNTSTIYYGLSEGVPTLWDENPVLCNPYGCIINDCSVYGKINVKKVYNIVCGTLYTYYIVNEKTFKTENDLLAYLMKGKC